MGPGIVIPIVLITFIVPVGFTWAKKLKRPVSGLDEGLPAAPAVRLTSNVLRELTSPPWRVIYEIATEKLGGIEHVVIGPPGAFAVQTTMDPLPPPADGAPDPRALAAAAIVRGALDDALSKCAMSSDQLLRVHWGAESGGPVSPLPGVTAVDGRSLTAWAESLDTAVLSPAQVDLAWQTVLTAIGRPDPLV